MEAGARTIDTAITALPPKRDLRRERSVETRARILEACRSLMRGGELRPTANAIARTLGIAQRTVFAHYRIVDELYAEALDADMRTFVARLIVRDCLDISDQDRDRIVRAALTGAI